MIMLGQPMENSPGASFLPIQIARSHGHEMIVYLSLPYFVGDFLQTLKRNASLPFPSKVPNACPKFGTEIILKHESTILSGIQQSLLLVVPGSLSSLLSTVSSSAVLCWEEARTVTQ